MSFGRTSLALLGGLALTQSAAALCRTVDAVPEFTWHAIGDTTPDEAWDCDGDNQPDSPGDAGTAADDYLVRDNHAVFVVGDILQDGLAPDTGIAVLGDLDGNGTPGALVADVLLADAPQRLRLAVNAAGLLCVGRCELTGAFRAVGSPGLEPEPDSQQYFQAEDIVFCPGEDSTTEPDCNGELPLPGNPHTIRIVFGSGDPLLGEALAALHPDDVLCRFDPDAGGPLAFPDPNSCYDIAGLDTGDPPYVEVDVRRGSQDPAAFPLARRQIVQTSLSAPVQAGEMALCIDGSSATAGTAIDREDALLGRFLYFREGTESCDDGDANPCATQRDGYKITRLDLLSPDCPAGSYRITLGDVRGFREEHAAGEEIWIGYSILGPFLVMAPVEVASATTRGGDSLIDLRGPTFVQAAVFTEPRLIHLRASASVERFAHFWIRDAGKVGLGSAAPLLRVESEGAEIGPGSITGARAEVGCGNMGTEPCAPAHAVLIEANDTHLHDLFSWPSRGHTYTISTTGHTGNSIERLYAGPLVDDAPLSRLMEMTTAASILGIGPVTLARDAFCDGCANKTAISGWAGQIDGLMLWNGSGGTDPRAPTYNLMIVGARSAEVVGANIDRFVVRDSTIEAAPLSLVDIRWNVHHPGEGLYNRNGFLQRVTFPQQLIDYDDTHGGLPLYASPGLIENVGFFDVKGRLVHPPEPEPVCLACRLFQFEVDPFAVGRRITVGFTEGFNAALGELPNIEYGIYNFSGDSDFTKLTLDGLLLTGFRNNVSTIDFPFDENFSQVTWGHGPCLFDNDVDTLPGKDALLPPTAVFGDPGFVDPESYRFDVQRGSLADQAGCGISRTNPPGILQKRWMHRLANIEPEFVPEPAGPLASVLALTSVVLLATRRSTPREGLPRGQAGAPDRERASRGSDP